MSKVASSPTARLLQSSRLFSLPRPLPLQPELTSGTYRTSETATSVHPTHQAIITPASSLYRGDYGLKRAIPNKRKNKKVTSTPPIRILEQDNYFHYTNFASAGDHVQTERKWAQMEIPLIHDSGRRSKYSRNQGGPMSVFEEHLDNTDPKAVSGSSSPSGGLTGAHQNAKGSQRWKHKGPWLAGMQDGEFEKWLEETVHHGASSRSRWRQFLREKLWNEKRRKAPRRREASRQLMEDGISERVEPVVEPPTAAELRAYQKQLRDQHAANGLSSPLTALICEFLDLPNVYSEPQTSTGLNAEHALQLASLTSSTADAGPPTTHPSAGLGHLRTNAVMHNHPIQGPQKDRPAVESRVVRPRTAIGKVLEYQAKIGVGGVVTNDPVSATSKNPSPRASKEEDQMTHQLNDELEGGNKLWVIPESAYIDHTSRIRLSVNRAGPEAVAVAIAGQKDGSREKINEIMEMKTASRLASPAKPTHATLPDGMGLRRPPSPATALSGRQPAVEPRRYNGVPGFHAEMSRAR